MYKVSGTTITMVKGDSAVFNISLTRASDGTEYTPEDGDVINFYLKDVVSGDDEVPLLHKTVNMETMQLLLDPSDTKSLVAGRYKYDLELVKKGGFTDTFLNRKALVLLEEVG